MLTYRGNLWAYSNDQLLQYCLFVAKKLEYLDDHEGFANGVYPHSRVTHVRQVKE